MCVLTWINRVTSDPWFSYKSKSTPVLAFSLTILTLYYFHTNLVPFECKNPKLQGISSVLRQEYTENLKPPNSVGCHLNSLIVKVGGERRVRHISVLIGLTKISLEFFQTFPKSFDIFQNL